MPSYPYGYPSSGSSSSRSSSSSSKEKYPISSPSQPRGSQYPTGSSSSGSKSASSSLKPNIINGSPYYQDKTKRYKTQDPGYFP